MNTYWDYLFKGRIAEILLLLLHFTLKTPHRISVSAHREQRRYHPISRLYFGIPKNTDKRAYQEFTIKEPFSLRTAGTMMSM